MIYSGKKAIVLGLGRSGEAAALLLHEEGAQVTIRESQENPQIQARVEFLRKQGIAVALGEEADCDHERFDVAILSPGIDPVLPIVQNVVARHIPIIGELELAYRECACPVVAITGTNGKTTTTELIATMLAGCGLRVMASGNIGTPFSEAVRYSNTLDMMVLEVSSFQLETVQAFHPHIAVWLNFSANHLDRYPTIEAYRAAKLRIFENLTSNDFVIANALENLPQNPARLLTFSAHSKLADFTLQESTISYKGTPILDQDKTHLAGVHNAENLMAAFAVGISLGLETSRMAHAILDYVPPVHRCEKVRKLDGVDWVNDSKSTNLDALEKALLSHPRSLILIAGGKDKGFEFDAVASLVKDRVRKAILIGEMRDRIKQSWSGTDCISVDSLEAAIAVAFEEACAGETVLFSPGTSSFDMFKSYEARGDRFKELVCALPSFLENPFA